MPQEGVIKSRKRRRKEKSEELCTQSKRMRQCGSKWKQPQSVSFCEENESNQAIPNNMLTCCYKSGETKRRRQLIKIVCDYR